MTWALCLNCGAVKFGALNPCPECKAGATGNFSLDIAFSSHHVSVSILRDLSYVIRQIREVCADDEVRFWTFINYVSENYPTILKLKSELEPEMATKVHDVLTRVALPTRPTQKKKWWQFWH